MKCYSDTKTLANTLGAAMAYTELTENDDIYAVLNVADADDDIFNGMGGNDTFLINSYVFGVSISGANNDGFRSELQLDVVQLSVSDGCGQLHYHPCHYRPRRCPC